LTIRKVAGIKIAALLLKPDAYKKNIPINYVGFKIPNDFVVGFGLDYDGYGRNLPSVYNLVH
jgi:hypoxanthine phosphoribosyltransferase